MQAENKSRWWFILAPLCLPLFFVLHGINQHFGLIPWKDVVILLAWYLFVTSAVIFFSARILKHGYKSTFFVYFVLIVFFFFGVFKDFTKQFGWLSFITSYKILLPAIALSFIVVPWLLKKSPGTFRRTSLLLSLIVFVNLAVEAGLFIYNTFTKVPASYDFGDPQHQLIRDVRIADTSSRPHIFWIVLDEYSSSAVLRENWGFHNPVDTVLRNKGFFVADSATSPYNYTQYSLLGTLDMQYLPELSTRDKITYRDIVRSQLSLEENNVVSVLLQAGYKVQNFSVTHMNGIPASPFTRFGSQTRMLIDNETLPGRTSLDIGWNFPYLFMSPNERDSAIATEVYTSLHALNDSTYRSSMDRLKQHAAGSDPQAFLIHTMFSHDPFLYDADGKVNVQLKQGVLSERYIPTIQYTNTVLNRMIDSIQSWYAGKEFTIVIQGDHGFKFRETDPKIKTEMCKIFYAVYCSDGNYEAWHHRVNSVNTFRLLFNKYLGTRFDELPAHSFTLYYQ